MAIQNVSMDIYQPWRLAPIICILLFILSRRTFSLLDDPAVSHNCSHRAHSVDGLRGFLALGVFFAHASAYRGYMLDGDWGAGPSAFFNQLGGVGVSLFFMITGYLFWGKAISSASDVRSLKEYWSYLKRLYISRFFRIAPLYYVLIITMLTIVLFETGVHLYVTPLKCIKEIINWMLLGLGSIIPVNGYAGPTVLAGMVWSLRWEWYFYLSLSVTSLFAFSRTARLLLPVTTLSASTLLSLSNHSALPQYLLLFSVGMISASLPRITYRSMGVDIVRSTLAGTLLATAYFGVFSSRNVAQTLLLAAFFYLIVNGCNLFGILTTRAANRLGAISYSIYLMHGICLYAVFSNARLREYAIESVTHYWSTVFLTTIVVAGVSSLTFIFIERPGIALGRALVARSVLPHGSGETSVAAAV